MAAVDEVAGVAGRDDVDLLGGGIIASPLPSKSSSSTPSCATVAGGTGPRLLAEKKILSAIIHVPVYVNQSTLLVYKRALKLTILQT